MSIAKKINTETLNSLIKRGQKFDEREAAFIKVQKKALQAFKTSLTRKKGSLDTESKKLLRTFIKNKKIPLVNRWNMFAAAPDAFKNYSPYLPKMGPEFNSFIKANIEDEGRGTHVNMTDWGHELIFNYVEDGNDSFLEWDTTDTLTNAALLEDILTHNLGSFCYDW